MVPAERPVGPTVAGLIRVPEYWTGAVRESLVAKIYRGVEEQIQDAIARGEFDNLSTKGKPLDLRAWRETPPHLRMGYSILKNARVTPPEVQVKQDLAEAKARLDDPSLSDEERAAVRRKVNVLIAVNAVRQERLTRQGKRGSARRPGKPGNPGKGRRRPL